MKLKRCLCGGKAEISFHRAVTSGIPGVLVVCERCGEHIGVWSCIMSLENMIKQARHDWKKHLRHQKKRNRAYRREERYIKFIGRFGKGQTLSLLEKMEMESLNELNSKKETQ